MFYNFEQNIMDMTLEEILRLRDMAEHTGVQFKERVTKENKSEVAAERLKGFQGRHTPDGFQRG